MHKEVAVFIREYDLEPLFKLADVAALQSCIPSSRHFDHPTLLIALAELVIGLTSLTHFVGPRGHVYPSYTPPATQYR
jgi:hypothetical protein